MTINVSLNISVAGEVSLFEFENYYNDFGLNFNSVLIICWSSM